MFLPSSPTVVAALVCQLWRQDGTQCLQNTGSDGPGIDADLCPEHRAEMDMQRQVNSLRAAEMVAVQETHDAAEALLMERAQALAAQTNVSQ